MNPKSEKKNTTKSKGVKKDKSKASFRRHNRRPAPAPCGADVADADAGPALEPDRFEARAAWLTIKVAHVSQPDVSQDLKK